MDMQKVDMYLMTNNKYFPQERIGIIKDKLASLDESRFMMATTTELKDPTVLLIISILLGYLGIDRFMLGEVGLGVAKLLTAGGCGIWAIVDWFTVQKRTKELNYNKIMSIM